MHLIAVSHTPDALSQSLKQAHGRYASYWNARKSSTGHVWQGRFYSCSLDESHLWAGLRYVELNPVRTGMVAAAELWKWSSAATHCGLAGSDLMLNMERWRKRWTESEWGHFLPTQNRRPTSARCVDPRTPGGRSGLLSSWLLGGTDFAPARPT